VVVELVLRRFVDMVRGFGGEVKLVELGEGWDFGY
jgi:hypothetical protein